MRNVFLCLGRPFEGIAIVQQEQLFKILRRCWYQTFGRWKLGCISKFNISMLLFCFLLGIVSGLQNKELQLIFETKLLITIFRKSKLTFQI